MWEGRREGGRGVGWKGWNPLHPRGAGVLGQEGEFNRAITAVSAPYGGLCRRVIRGVGAPFLSCLRARVIDERDHPLLAHRCRWLGSRRVGLIGSSRWLVGSEGVRREPKRAQRITHNSLLPRHARGGRRRRPDPDRGRGADAAPARSAQSTRSARSETALPMAAYDGERRSLCTGGDGARVRAAAVIPRPRAPSKRPK